MSSSLSRLSGKSLPDGLSSCQTPEDKVQLIDRLLDQMSEDDVQLLSARCAVRQENGFIENSTRGNLMTNLPMSSVNGDVSRSSSPSMISNMSKSPTQPSPILKNSNREYISPLDLMIAGPSCNGLLQESPSHTEIMQVTDDYPDANDMRCPFCTKEFFIIKTLKNHIKIKHESFNDIYETLNNIYSNFTKGN